MPAGPTSTTGHGHPGGSGHPGAGGSAAFGDHIRGPGGGAPGAGQPTATLADLLEPLRRRWWAILLAALLGAGGGWILAGQQPAVYTSSAQVLVWPVGPDADDDVNLDTEAQLVRSAQTTERARPLIDGGDLIPALSDRVSVRVPANTQVLEISYEASTPRRARQGANAFATAYLERRSDQAATIIDARSTQLTTRIDQLRTDEAPHQVIVALESERALVQALTTDGGEVISPGTLPVAPTSPNARLYLLSGLVAGLLLGIGATTVRHRLDGRVPGSRPLPPPLRDRVLLDLPVRPPAAVADHDSEPGRQFARLRNLLRARAVGSPPPTWPAVWLVCGVGDTRATGAVTANLAAVAGRGPGRVVAITADRSSTALSALGLYRPPEQGLAEVLAGTPAPEALRTSPVADGVAVMTDGQLGSATDLGAGELVSVVTQLPDDISQVIIELPALPRSADALAVGGVATAVLLVAERHTTRLDELSGAVRDLLDVGATTVAVLLVPPPRRGLPAGLPVPRRRRVPLGTATPG